MYTHISYATLQLHAGNDSNHTTLSKTVAVYDYDHFIYQEKNRVHSGQIKTVIAENVKLVVGEYSDLLNQFSWNLN